MGRAPAVHRPQRVPTTVDLLLARVLRAAISEDWHISAAIEGLITDAGGDPLVLGAARARLVRRPDPRPSLAVQRSVAALSAALEIALSERRP